MDEVRAILEKRDITIEDLKKFLPIELKRATAELRKHDNSPAKDSYYKAYGDILDTILTFIVSPEKEREQLKTMLKQKYGVWNKKVVTNNYSYGQSQ